MHLRLVDEHRVELRWHRHVADVDDVGRRRSVVAGIGAGGHLADRRELDDLGARLVGLASTHPPPTCGDSGFQRRELGTARIPAPSASGSARRVDEISSTVSGGPDDGSQIASIAAIRRSAMRPASSSGMARTRSPP